MAKTVRQSRQEQRIARPGYPRAPRSCRNIAGQAGGTRNENRAVAEYSAPAIARGDGGAADETHLVEQIRDLLGTNAAPLVGRLNLIGLTKIKDRFGPTNGPASRNAPTASRAMSSSGISRPAISMRSWGEETYVMVFARLGEAEARVKCFLIANEIAKNLLGEDGAEQPRDQDGDRAARRRDRFRRCHLAGRAARYRQARRSHRSHRCDQEPRSKARASRIGT